MEFVQANEQMLEQYAADIPELVHATVRCLTTTIFPSARFLMRWSPFLAHAQHTVCCGGYALSHRRRRVVRH